MRQFIDLTVVGLALTVGLLLTGGAAAETISAAPADQVDAVGDSGCGDPLTGGELDVLTGGQGQNIDIGTFFELDSNVSQPVTIKDNSIIGTITNGNNTIAPGAFTNIHGIAPVILNSGNQVSITNSIIVNLYTD